LTFELSGHIHYIYNGRFRYGQLVAQEHPRALLTKKTNKQNAHFIDILCEKNNL